MTKKTSDNKGSMGPKALEMVMRDVLGGMEEFAIMKAYESSGTEFKVVTIQPSSRVASNEGHYERDYLESLATEFEEDYQEPMIYSFETMIDQPEPGINEPEPPRHLAEVIVLDEYLKKRNLK